VVRTIVSLSGHPELEPIILNEVKNEIQDEYLDPSQAERAFGWRPNYSLTAGLAEAMTWYHNFLQR
jgi:nucleoside-diphosphate-sugar epimerase